MRCPMMEAILARRCSRPKTRWPTVSRAFKTARLAEVAGAQLHEAVLRDAMLHNGGDLGEAMLAANAAVLDTARLPPARRAFWVISSPVPDNVWNMLDWVYYLQIVFRSTITKLCISYSSLQTSSTLKTKQNNSYFFYAYVFRKMQVLP